MVLGYYNYLNHQFLSACIHQFLENSTLSNLLSLREKYFLPCCLQLSFDFCCSEKQLEYFRNFENSINFLFLQGSMGAYVLFYIFCQALIFGVLYRKIPYLLEYTHIIPIGFYIFSALSFVSYFIVKCKSPGYLTPEQHTPIKIQDRRPTPLPQDFNDAKRYCLACHQQQPYRVKHCTLCHKCVRGFDHHCPLVDNCIGQKNRPHFLCFLILQNIQIVFAILLVEKNMSFKQIDYGTLAIFILLLVFVSVLGSLLIFHMYLMFKNILTWQFFCWDSINYLQNYKPNTNPFNQGILTNLKLYWVFGCCRSDYYQWELNKQQIIKQPFL